jgi:GTPase-associated protein 1
VPANDFGTAIYTNCAPEQGLDGVAGMQFQSRSAGVDREALAVIRRHLIYEPPERLIQERQPVDAFPPSFAHVCDGVFATAAGVYVGPEAEGARQGNHLTHAIVTGDRRAYRSVRPVQLFHAPFWRTEPTDSKESERLGPSWQPGPFDAGRAAQFVRDQPDGRVLLSAILTTLLAHLRGSGHDQPRRVLFIADDAESVLLWLTAATLLIPQDEAVRLGFKVFTTDPARSTLPVVAVHPGWVRSAATVEHDRGYVVFDLVNHRWTAFEPSAEAKHWAQRFCQADPYEVSEAVELANASGMPGETGRDLATVAVLHEAPSLSSAEWLARWLLTGPPALREAYGGSLTAALAQLQDLRVLREVDSAADGQFPGRRDQIRLSLLRLELDNALRDPLMFQPDRPQRPVSPAIESEAVRLVAEALRRAQGSAFDAALRVSNRFRVPVPFDAVHGVTSTFVEYWVKNPEAAYEPSAWPSTLPVSDMLRDELLARIADEPELADKWYRRFPLWAPDTADLTSPLERALLSAAMAGYAPPERMRIVRSILGRHGSGAARGRYRELANLLWGRTTPTVDELRELCSRVPVGEPLGPALFAGVLAGAHDDPVKLPELELCGSLAEKHLVELDSATKQRLADHRWLQEFEYRLGPAPTAQDTHDDYLLHISPAVLNAHAKPLAHGLLTLHDPVRANRLLQMLPEPVVVAYLRSLHGYRLRPLGPAEVALIVSANALLVGHGPSIQVRRDLYVIVEEWCRNSSKRKIHKVTSYLDSFGGGLAPSWEAYAEDVHRPRLWHGRSEPGR